jgi:hypothetical protein
MGFALGKPQRVLRTTVLLCLPAVGREEVAQSAGGGFIGHYIIPPSPYGYSLQRETKLKNLCPCLLYLLYLTGWIECIKNLISIPTYFLSTQPISPNIAFPIY